VLISGPRFLVLRQTDGTRIRVARQFTDADGIAPERDGPREADRVFTVESLRELMAVIDAVLHRA
jgi:hypothetical protein